MHPRIGDSLHISAEMLTSKLSKTSSFKWTGVSMFSSHWGSMAALKPTQTNRTSVVLLNKAGVIVT